MSWLRASEILALKAGARVHAEIDGVLVGPVTPGHWMRIQDEHETIHHLWAGDDPDRMPRIALAAPDFWPPRKGDTWEAGGVEYFCHVVHSGIFGLIMVSAEGESYNNDDGFAGFLALGPQLVRRNQ